MAVTAAPQVSLIPLPHQPRFVVAAADGRRAYVTFDETAPGGATFGGVGVVDIQTHDVIVIPVGHGVPAATGLVESPETQRLYVHHFSARDRCSAVSVSSTRQPTASRRRCR